MPFVTAELTFSAAQLPTDAAHLGIRLERQSVRDGAVLLLYPTGRGAVESTYRRYICDLALQLPSGAIVGPGQFVVTARRFVGFVAQSPLGSLLSGPSSSVQAFSIDREDLGEFRMELNWRDRVKLITVTPRPGYASGFGLKVTDASLSVDDHGTTKSASLDKVAKAYDDISWTTQPSAARPPSGPSAGAQRPPTPTNVTSAGRANSETFKLIQVLAPGDSDGSLYPAVSDGSLPILMDSWDQTRTIVKGVSLTLSRYANREKKELAAFSKRDVTLLVTDARVAVVCVDWNKGQGSGTSFGHFAGSQVNVALANKARKLKEAHDRAGRILAGHARYGWISDVGYQPAYQRFLPQIHICIPGSEGDTLVLGVTLTAKVDSAALAQTIAQRTAAYRLKYSLPANDTRSRLARLAAGPPPLASPEPGKLATYSIPGYVSPSVDTALPA